MNPSPSNPAIPSVRGFWDFVALRQEAYWLRQRGLKSSNQMMAENHWPNVFRELDKGTVYFQEQTVNRTTANIIFSSVVYRLLNRQRTFVDLGGIPRIAEANVFLEGVKKYREGGNPIFTHRHLTPSWASYTKMFIFMDNFLEDFVSSILLSCTLHQVWSHVKQVPGIGGFLSWQVCCDLLESDVLNFSENQWVYVGPGPRNAFQLLLHVDSVTQIQCIHRLKWLYERQHIFLSQGSIEFRFPENITEITLKNLEHAMCEYYRWVAAHWKEQS